MIELPTVGVRRALKDFVDVPVISVVQSGHVVHIHLVHHHSFPNGTVKVVRFVQQARSEQSDVVELDVLAAVALTVIYSVNFYFNLFCRKMKGIIKYALVWNQLIWNNKLIEELSKNSSKSAPNSGVC